LSRPTRENRIASPQPFDREKSRTLTVKEAAYRLRKSVDAVYKWLRQGRLRGWQLGGRGCAVMVSEESVEAVLAGQMGESRLNVNQ
jgi:excisionase family DNA binding protein